MKNILNIKTLFFVAIASFIFTSCTDDDYQKPVEEVVTEPITAGTADFSTYVAVGNSLTSGFTDGALFIKGQEMSIPNLVSKKFALIGGGSFTQPLMADNNGGLLFGGTMIQGPRLYFNGSGPAPVAEAPTTEIMSSTPGPYNNMGVPGAKVTHLLYPGYGDLGNLLTTPPTANPYYVRMASSSTATVINDATSQNPTFFTLWIGSNDVLQYALNGGDDSLETITDPATFDNAYNAVVNGLTANGAKGVILNLSDITAIPHFTTVPYNPVPLDAGTAQLLNGAFVQYNGGVQQVLAGFVSANMITQEMADEEIAKRTIHFEAGENNAVTIVDEDLMDLTAYGVPNYRQATAADLLVLPSSSFIGTEVNNNPQLINGVSVPLADKWVLTPNEQTAIQTATDAYNTTIESVAAAKDLAFIDVNGMTNNVANGGVQFDEFNMTSQYIFGNMFSLDGIHPTERGNAFIANEILKAIDAKYGSNFEASGNLNKAKDFVTQYPATIQ